MKTSDAGSEPSAPAAQPPGIIVMGMHRSGTSLTTSVLATVGWQANGSMLTPTRSQPLGFFEDTHIHNLHKNVLAKLGTEWDHVLGLRRLTRQEGLALAPGEDKVRDLVDQLRGGGPWVWKNPRASLFIDDWARRLPEAHIVICLRSPAHVADSMRRRHDPVGIVVGQHRFIATRRVWRYVSLWHTYNAAVFRFARRHPQRVTIVRIPEDLPALAAASAPSPFRPGQLATRPGFRARVIAGLSIRSQILYRRLSALAEPGRVSALLDGPGP